MLNTTILRLDLRQNRKLWLGFLVFMSVCTLGILSLYDPALGLKHTDVLATVPEKVAAALGVRSEDASLTGFLASWLFGLCYLAVPFCYSLILVNRLVTLPVENGMMAYCLSAPGKRRGVIGTKAYLFCISLLGLFFLNGVFGGVVCAVWYPGELELSQYLLLWLGAFGLHLFLGGAAFFISCVCHRVWRSVAAGTGLFLLFLIPELLGRLGGGMEILGYFTPFTLFSPWELLEGDFSLYWKLPVSGILGVVLCWLGGSVFERKELSL